MSLFPPFLNEYNCRRAGSIELHARVCVAYDTVVCVVCGFFFSTFFVLSEENYNHFFFLLFYTNPLWWGSSERQTTKARARVILTRLRGIRIEYTAGGKQNKNVTTYVSHTHIHPS